MSRQVGEKEEEKKRRISVAFRQQTKEENAGPPLQPPRIAAGGFFDAQNMPRVMINVETDKPSCWRFFWMSTTPRRKRSGTYLGPPDRSRTGRILLTTLRPYQTSREVFRPSSSTMTNTWGSSALHLILRGTLDIGSEMAVQRSLRITASRSATSFLQSRYDIAMLPECRQLEEGRGEGSRIRGGSAGTTPPVCENPLTDRNQQRQAEAAKYEWRLTERVRWLLELGRNSTWWSRIQAASSEGLRIYNG